MLARLGSTFRVALAALAALTSACAAEHQADSEPPPSREEPDEPAAVSCKRGWLELMGPQIGDGSREVGSIPGPQARLTTSDSGLEAGRAFRFLQDSGELSTLVLVELRNRDRDLVAVILDPVRGLTGGRETIRYGIGFERNVSGAWVFGSAGTHPMLPNFIHGSCLDRGETGFLQLEGSPPDVELIEITPANIVAVERPESCLVPTRYAYEAQTLSIEFVNAGSARHTDRTGTTRFIVLNDQGEPLAVGQGEGVGVPVDAGAGVTVHAPFTFSGKSQRLLVVMSFI